MHLDQYPIKAANDYQDYEFISNGPQGKIKKIVRYTKVSDAPVTYNLAFGDEDKNGVISDTVRSNNGDRDRVLATVANTIHSFCDHYGNPFIYVEGSTPVRTRLYQLSIARLWEEIGEDFNLLGYHHGDWHAFEPNVNYEAFLIQRK